MQSVNTAQPPSIALQTVFQDELILNTSEKGGLRPGAFRDMVPASVCIGTFLIGTSEKIGIIQRVCAFYAYLSSIPRYEGARSRWKEKNRSSPAPLEVVRTARMGSPQTPNEPSGPENYCASACWKSAMTSSGFSMPQETRIMLSGMPRATRCSGVKSW